LPCSDIGRAVAEAIFDPRTYNRELVLDFVPVTQKSLASTWHKLSGVEVKQTAVSEDTIKGKLEELKKGMPGTFMYLMYHQLVHDVWYHGYGGGAEGEQLSAAKLYPAFKATSAEEFLGHLVKK